MALIEYHRSDDRMSVEFSGSVIDLLGVKTFTGTYADFKRLTKNLAKKDEPVGDPIVLELFKPPAEESEDE